MILTKRRAEPSQTMKKIEAIIPSSQLKAVRAALEQRGIRSALTLMEVKWSSGHKGSADEADSEALQSRVQLDLMVEDRQVQKAVDTILRYARPGSDQGNGHIVVLDVNETVQISRPEPESPSPQQ
jgi:nitrogen regulatory protein PII